MDFRILGPLEVRQADGRVEIRGVKSRRVLAALLCAAGQAVAVEQLVEAVWEGDPPPTGRKQVQNTVSALRQTEIGPLLVARGWGYALDVRPEWVDAGRFAQHLSAAERARGAGDPSAAAEALRTALDLWRGPALAGIGGRVAEAAAVRLEERRLRATILWAELAMELGRPAEVLAELDDVVDQHPFREPLAGLQMLALYRCGRPGEAIAHYHRVRQALRAELGLDPGPELRRLFERMLAADPALGPASVAPTGRNDLPRDTPHFTGRAAELDRLVSAADGATLLIQAIDGMAGVGKTALAVHAAHRLAERFTDAQLYVNLHGHTPGREPLTPEVALDLLLRAVGIPDEAIPTDLDPLAARWRAEMAGRRVLVVLDNAASTDQVAPLLPGSGHSVVLVTSRRRLAGLNATDVLSLDVLSEQDAVALLRRIAGPDHGSAAQSDLAEVVRLCGHLPLAIGVVAARLRNRPSWTVAHLVERLRDQRDGLVVVAADDHRVAAALAVSYQHLSPDQQRMYRLLGLHPGPDVDAYAAAALAGLPLRDTRQLLEALCDVHLLTQPTPGRYRFHDLVRDHARATTGEPASDHAQAQLRLFDYYLHVSEIAADRVVSGRLCLGPPPEHVPTDTPPLAQVSQASGWFHLETNTLSAVAQLAAGRSTADHGWQIARNLSAHLWLHGQFAAGRDVLNVALTAFRPDTDATARIVCLVDLALMHSGLGEYHRALEHLDKALAVSRGTGDRATEGLVLAHMAEETMHVGPLTNALTLATRAVEVHRSQGQRRQEAEALAVALEILLRVGRHHDAIDWGGRARVLLDATSDYLTEAAILSGIGTAHSQLGEHDAALGLLVRAVEIARGAKDRRTEGSHLHRVAQALRRAGRLDDARETALMALNINHDLAKPSDLAQTHNALGAIHHDCGEYDEALSHYRQALAVAESVGYQIGQAVARKGLGRVLHALGDHELAEQHRQQASCALARLGIPRPDWDQFG